MTKRLTIEEMQHLAESKGGVCLSKVYKNSKSKLTWKCSKGHEWESRPNDIKNNHWCPECAPNKSSTIQDFHKLAKLNKGKCLTKRYNPKKGKDHWECNKGHKWWATPISVKNGGWCASCKGVKLLTIGEMRSIAKSNGGKCLSKKYVNSSIKLLWECKYGHQWHATPTKIKNKKQWCPKCYGRQKLTIEDMHETAKEFNGKCLSTKYVNSQTKLEWQCSENHKWKANPGDVRNGHWCPYCAGKARGTIEEMQNIAQERGGECLSTIYKNRKTKLKWECNCGHIWMAIPYTIIRGSWCPECGQGLGERIARSAMEQLFDTGFPHAYPKWLKPKNGNQLELDGYNEELKLAFEHNGIQHYEIDGYFIKTKSQLNKRKRIDQFKVDTCKQNGVALIVFPPIPDSLHVNQIPSFIIDQLTVNKYPISDRLKNMELDVKKLYIKTPELIEMRKLADDRGGELLSTYYINSMTNLTWKCSKGHIWEASPNNIKNNKTWCLECWEMRRKKPKHDKIEKYRMLAKSYQGECLSIIPEDKKLKWKCSNGHIWFNTYRNVKIGSWCKVCKDNKKMDELRAYANAYHGQLLSTEYITQYTDLQWQCRNGHVFYIGYKALRKRKYYCKECPKTNKV